MDLNQFEQRKKDHIFWSLDANSQAVEMSAWDQLHLPHEALPDLNLAEVSLQTKTHLGIWRTPFFVSSMTAGHLEGEKLNHRLAEAAHQKSWSFAFGSQRRDLIEAKPSPEWLRLKEKFPNLQMIGNIGLAQLLEFGAGQVIKSFRSLQPAALYIHLNPLQEALQQEGTPNFKGGLKEIEKLVSLSPFPILVKEVGTGMSLATIERLAQAGVPVVDISGAGGTHWGRVETLRGDQQRGAYQVGHAFWGWGHGTSDILLKMKDNKPSTEIWASGGIRNGVHAAKALALGAKAVGIAQPLMAAAQESVEAIEICMGHFEKELSIALFCTGSASIKELQERKIFCE